MQYMTHIIPESDLLHCVIKQLFLIETKPVKGWGGGRGCGGHGNKTF